MPWGFMNLLNVFHYVEKGMRNYRLVLENEQNEICEQDECKYLIVCRERSEYKCHKLWFTHFL